MKNQVKAVLFDAGHTLIESHPDVVGIYRQSALAFGAAIGADRSDQLLTALRAAYEQMTRQAMKIAVTDEADKDMWRTVTRRVHGAIPELQGIDFDPWFEHLHDMFVDPATWRPYEETVEVLDALRASGLRIAIVSNWSSNLPHILECIGLQHYFDAVVVSCIERCRKPDPAIFRCALERTGVHPSEAVHVGDTYEDDIVGATQAGIHGLLLNRGGRPYPNCTAIADLRGVLAFLACPPA